MEAEVKSKGKSEPEFKSEVDGLHQGSDRDAKEKVELAEEVVSEAGVEVEMEAEAKLKEDKEAETETVTELETEAEVETEMDADAETEVKAETK